MNQFIFQFLPFCPVWENLPEIESKFSQAKQEAKKNRKTPRVLQIVQDKA
jgi:hypothetical protein